MKPLLLSILSVAFAIGVASAGDFRAGLTEISLGLGATFPREKDPLNVPGELPMSNSLVLDFAARQYLGDMGAVGVRVFGTINKLSDYTVIPSGGGTPSSIEFNITTYTVALEALVFLSQSNNITPYILADVGFAGGLLTNKDMGSLPYRGFAAGGGAGIRFRLSERVALSFEGIGLVGSAKWKSPPFSNSSDDRYDPSTIITLSSISFLINK